MLPADLLKDCEIYQSSHYNSNNDRCAAARLRFRMLMQYERWVEAQGCKYTNIHLRYASVS
jgi:hypothetical protein